jgi:hypothetical protein
VWSTKENQASMASLILETCGSVSMGSEFHGRSA